MMVMKTTRNGLNTINVAAAVAVDPLCAVLPVYLVYPVYSVSLIAAPALSQALLTLVIMTFARSSG